MSRPCACGRGCGHRVAGKRVIHLMCQRELRVSNYIPKRRGRPPFTGDLTDVEIEQRFQQAKADLRYRRTVAA